MLDMYKRIKELRVKKGLTQSELAKMTGYSERSSIARIERGDVDISQSKIVEFAKALKVSTMYLMDGVDDQLPDGAIPLRTVPVLGTIACGTPIEAIQNYDEDIPLPDGIRADFALRCSGDSMAPSIKSGDYVFIRAQPDVDDGQVAAVVIDGEATLKKVYHIADGLLLIAENTNFPAIRAEKTEIIITGLAVGVFHGLI